VETENNRRYLFHRGYKEKVRVISFYPISEEYEVKRKNGLIFRDFEDNFEEISDNKTENAK